MSARLTHYLSGAVVWIVGRPASGKTTLARGLYAALRERGVPILWLDSDALRRVMTPQPTYAEVEREIFYDTVGYLAQRAAEGGALALVSATAPRRVWRGRVRAAVPRFVEVLVDCDEATLRARDVKGLYARADRGEIDGLPGAGGPWEPPVHPEIVVDAGRRSPAAMCEEVLGALERLAHGSPPP